MKLHTVTSFLTLLFAIIHGQEIRSSSSEGIQKQKKSMRLQRVTSTRVMRIASSKMEGRSFVVVLTIHLLRWDDEGSGWRLYIHIHKNIGGKAGGSCHLHPVVQ